MNRSTGIPGGTENAIDSIEPLESGRPDVIPSPPADVEDLESDDEQTSADAEDEVREKDLEQLERNNSIAREHPGEI